MHCRWARKIIERRRLSLVGLYRVDPAATVDTAAEFGAIPIVAGGKYTDVQQQPTWAVESAATLLATLEALTSSAGSQSKRSSKKRSGNQHATHEFEDDLDEEVGVLFDGASMSKKRKQAIKQVKAVFGNKQVKEEIWNRLDANGNGMASLAEIDKMVSDLSQTDKYGGFFRNLNHKPAIMRAYQWTIKREPGSDGDEWVEKREFNSLLKNLYFFNELWQIFEEIDTGNDRRVDFDEFREGMAKYGLSLDDEQAETMFKQMDSDGGGQILFTEFCEHFMSTMEETARIAKEAKKSHKKKKQQQQKKKKKNKNKSSSKK